jgi:hypothetical protein
MIAIKPPKDGRPSMLIASAIFRDYLTIHPCKYKLIPSNKNFEIIFMFLIK